jgi:hypothetical protein
MKILKGMEAGKKCNETMFDIVSDKRGVGHKTFTI